MPTYNYSVTYHIGSLKHTEKKKISFFFIRTGVSAVHIVLNSAEVRVTYDRILKAR